MRKILIAAAIAALPGVSLADTPADTLQYKIRFHEITVSANRQKEQIMTVPQSVYTINADRIADSNPQTSADMLVSDGRLTVQKSQQGGG
ncbi:MAG: hypothetical protein K2L28_07580, partial [Muribaculaceae bacterium]|nr:hypothetical protein [Muribaculaceae bacterium]